MRLGSTKSLGRTDTLLKQILFQTCRALLEPRDQRSAFLFSERNDSHSVVCRCFSSSRSSSPVHPSSRSCGPVHFGSNQIKLASANGQSAGYCFDRKTFSLVPSSIIHAGHYPSSMITTQEEGSCYNTLLGKTGLSFVRIQVSGACFDSVAFTFRHEFVSFVVRLIEHHDRYCVLLSNTVPFA